jgi:hypothetical protein
MAAEFIGIENIIEYLETLPFDQLKVYDSGRKDCLAIINKRNEEETEEDLINQLKQWFERTQKSNPVNTKLYYLQLMEKPEGAAKYRGTMSFSVALQASTKGAKEERQNIGGVTERELSLAIENERKNAYIDKLSEKIDMLMERLEEEEEEEEEEVSGIGSINELIVSKLPQIVDMFLAGMNKPTHTATALAGIEQPIENIIAEFKQINPQIEKDLAKLLEMAKTKPDLFKMLIAQLRSM